MVEMLLRVAPLWLVGLFCAGALSASMVTGGACALAAAATIGNDLLQPSLQWPDRKLKRAIQLLVFTVVGAAYVIALMRPALMVYIVLMAYSFTAQLFPAAITAFYTKVRSGRPVLWGLAAGFVTALIFVLHIVQPPYNIHPGVIGLAVNVTVLCITAKLFPGASTESKLHPRVKSPRLLIACGCVLVAIGNWPMLILANRIYPFVLGMPFFVFTMLALNVSVALLLLIAYRATDRIREFTRPST